MNAWTPIDACQAGVTPPAAAANIFIMEALVPTAVNVLPPLTHAPDGGFILLLLNGIAFLPVGASPPFAVAGNMITWQSAIYSIGVTDSVAVAYTYAPASA